MISKNKLNVLIVSINKSPNKDIYVPRTYDELYLPDEFYLNVEFDRLKYNVYFADQRDWTGEQFKQMYHSFEKTEPLSLEEISLVLVYDVFLNEDNFQKLKSFLEFSIEKDIPVGNHPKTILKTISKHYLKELMNNGINVVKPYITTNDKIKLINSNKKLIKKDAIGGGGYGFQIIAGSDVESFLEEKNIIQEFMPQYSDGEYSLIFLNGLFKFAISRHRNKNSGRFTNVTQGASLKEYMPSIQEIEFAKSVLNYFYSLKLPILYARIDFIKTSSGPMLTEAELQQPITPFIFKQWYSKEFCNALDQWRINWKDITTAS